MNRQQPLTESSILASLRDCYEPALGLNIVDLGLVQSIALAPDPDAPGTGIPGVPPRHRVIVAIILTDADGDSPLPALIQNRLAAFDSISRTEVQILEKPVWTPGLISPEGRLRLAANLNARRPANDLVQIDVQIET